MSMIAPRAIEQAGPSQLKIVWVDGHESVYFVPDLRRACRCAVCIDEWTGQPNLDPASVSDEVKPTRLEPVGRYAIQIEWSDGHSTGIYTWEHLRDICPCPECKFSRSRRQG